MIKFFKRIFGSSDVLKESIEIVRDAGDMMFYTDEEKAQDAAKRAERLDNLLVNWLEQTKGEKLSRRFLAMLVGCIWGFLFMFSWIVQQIAIWYNESADKFNAMSQANEKFLDQSTGAMMLVLAFYFAAPHMGEIVQAAMSRFGRTNRDSRK